MTETTRPLRLHGRNPAIYEALKEAGIVREGDYVRRVIIDINVECAPVVYVERYGDDRLLDLIRTLDGAEIRYADKENDVSIYDDGTDLGKAPVPVTETRGGENIDWEHARPGEPLPEKPPEPEESA